MRKVVDRGVGDRDCAYVSLRLLLWTLPPADDVAVCLCAAITQVYMYTVTPH